MTDSYANSTALLVAALRAAASNHPDPICSDPWAAALVGDSGQQLAERCLQATPHMDLWVAVRTAYIDAHVRTWANAQRPQVVLLSTGLDTRAARLAEDALRFFEVDGPEQLADKQTRIADLEDYPDDASTAVPCNLSEQSVIDALVDGGFDLDTPALFIWEGAARAMSQQTARDIFGDIARRCAAESLILFDILGRKAVDLETAPFDGDLRVGAYDVLPMLYEEGYRYVRSTSFDEACLMLTGTHDRERMFHLQHIVLAGRVPPAIP